MPIKQIQIVHHFTTLLSTTNINDTGDIHTPCGVIQSFQLFTSFLLGWWEGRYRGAEIETEFFCVAGELH